MSTTIWKFQLSFDGVQTIEMPKGANILAVQRDEKTSVPCLWALVDSSAPNEGRTFEMFGTGHPIHTDIGIERKYIGTFQYQRGQFIGHVFERTS